MAASFHTLNKKDRIALYQLAEEENKKLFDTCYEFDVLGYIFIRPKDKVLYKYFNIIEYLKYLGYKKSHIFNTEKYSIIDVKFSKNIEDKYTHQLMINLKEDRPDEIIDEYLSLIKLKSMINYMGEQIIRSLI